MSPRRAALLPALLAALALSACTGGSGPSGEPEDVLAEAKTTLDETSGVKVVLATDELPKGIDGVLTAEGVATHAPAFDGVIDVRAAGIRLSADVIAIDGAVYAKLPFRSSFSEIDPADYGAPDPAQLLSTDEGISSWLTAVEGLEEGDEVREGDEVLGSYTGTLPGTAVEAVIPSADEDATFDVTFTINGDNELVAAEVTGPFYPEGGDVTYTVTFSDYGLDTAISKP